MILDERRNELVGISLTIDQMRYARKAMGNKIKAATSRQKAPLLSEPNHCQQSEPKYRRCLYSHRRTQPAFDW